ncbi:hypothetical protein Kfla_1084 [Kribbella flavida DSM 17836]|uniref:Uncharacterized protein n=2 Tax=Kribbella flavida TaxID=182640 RepID=D2Q2K7_KRIFD|nr:hypothetical protein Kfla_1084 [Kribbella flavida DSM 17836]
MQLVENRPASVDRLRRRYSAMRLLPWLLPALVAVSGLRYAGVPADAIATYCGYFGAGVVLPGTLLLRLIWRSTGNWVEDVALGAATGTACQFIGWAGFTALGLQQWLAIWPAAVLVAFVAVPRLRRYWRIDRPAPLPLRWSWGVAIAVAVMLFGVVAGPLLYHLAPGTLENNLQQPVGTEYHQDLLYHLSMVHELMRSVPPQLPQVAGEALDYHWFANADMAAAAHITGLSAELVLFRLWLVPLTAVTMLLTAVLARQISREWPTAVIAVGILAVPAAGALIGHQRLSVVGTLIYYASPSQTFALIALVAAAFFLVEVLYRTSSSGAWVLAVTFAVLGGGAKPTVLPLLLGAVGLAGLYVAVRKRGVPWRSVIAGGILLSAGTVAMLTVTGSTGGSGFRPLAVLRAQGPSYWAATGDRSLAASGDFLLRPIAEGRVVAVVTLLAVLLVGQLGMLVGFGLLASRRMRTDPAGWFLLGGLTAGWLAFLLVDHPSSSEYYFLRGLVPFAAVAAAWMISIAIRGRSLRQGLMLAVLGVVFGVAVVPVQELVEVSELGTGWSAVLALARGPLVVLVAMLLAWHCWRRLLNAWPGLVGMGLLIPVMMTIGVSLGSTIDQAAASRASTARPVYTSKNLSFSVGEQAAARWLRENTGPHDVVATNTACWPNRKDCVALGYLVSGLGGRRTLLEGWAYTQQAMAEHGTGGNAYMFQPAPWQERAQLNRLLFSAPTAETLRQARDEYGVRWLFVDRAHDREPVVSTGTNLELQFENGAVSVFRITDDQARS